MPDPSAPRGRFVWYDLSTTDTDGALRFYPEVMGWGTQPFEGPMPYTMFTKGDTPVGGVGKITDEQRAQGIPAHWMGHVGVANVDASAAEAKRLGGNVLYGPEDIPTVGRFAVIADPQGAMLSIFTPIEEMSGGGPPQGEPAVGDISWHELTTTDHAAAFDFYNRLFGWEKTDQFDMGEPMGIYQMFGQGGTMYGGMFNCPPGMNMPPSWLYYVRVPDVNRAIEAAKRLGGQVMNGPMEVPGGDLIAQCTDPQGAWFAVHQKVGA